MADICVCVRENGKIVLNDKKIAEKLKLIRMAYGYSQRSIGEYVDISRQGYAHYEAGTRVPDITTLYKLSILYGIPMNDMVNDKLVITSKDFVGEEALYSTSEMTLETELLNNFRRIDDEDKEMVFEFVKKLARKKK